MSQGDLCKLLTVLVRFFDVSTESIITHHLETVYTTNFTAQGIYSVLKDILEKHTTAQSYELYF